MSLTHCLIKVQYLTHLNVTCISERYTPSFGDARIASSQNNSVSDKWGNGSCAAYSKCGLQFSYRWGGDIFTGRTRVNHFQHVQNEIQPITRTECYGTSGVINAKWHCSNRWGVADSKYEYKQPKWETLPFRTPLCSSCRFFA